MYNKQGRKPLYYSNNCDKCVVILIILLLLHCEMNCGEVKQKLTISPYICCCSPLPSLA